MISLKIDLNSIRSMDLVRCFSILALQYQPFDNHETPVTQTGVLGGGAPCLDL